MAHTVDERILATYRHAGTEGLCSLQVEDKLRSELGDSTHQTITGNTRHLVERGELIHIDDRFFRSRKRRYYVTPENYSPGLHGEPDAITHRNRRVQTEEERAAARRKVENAGSDSLLSQIRHLFAETPNGLTCREIEHKFGIPHQTASARLSELRAAGFITRSGTRAIPGERRDQPVYLSVAELAGVDGDASLFN